MGVKETFADLFACLKCASNFDINPEDTLRVTLGDVEYSPAERPASIRLHRVYYMVMFYLGE